MTLYVNVCIQVCGEAGAQLMGLTVSDWIQWNTVLGKVSHCYELIRSKCFIEKKMSGTGNNSLNTKVIFLKEF